LKRNPAPLPGKVAALLRESRLFVLAAAALYLFLVLTTFNRADPGWSHSVAAGEIRNLGGRAGAWLADMLLSLFGVSAWWWVVLLACGIWMAARPATGGHPSSHSPGFACCWPDRAESKPCVFIH
jgi:S-DNA-T family DNA segregation ATPase FtsK/SpoIIIE